MQKQPDMSKKTVVGMSDDYLKKSVAFMMADLAKSGLIPSDMAAVADPVNVEVRKEVRPFIDASYMFPYYDLDGVELTDMYRRRRMVRPGAEKYVTKYTQPQAIHAKGYGTYPYMPPTIWTAERATGVVHICEGEKKTASLIKHTGEVAMGIPGKDVGHETVKVLISALKKLGARRVCLWPDADVSRFDVRKSYGRLRDKLVDGVAGLAVDVMLPAWDGEMWKGIDDALAGGWVWVGAGGAVVGEELPIDMKALADRIGLDYAVGEKGDKFQLVVNEFNVAKILREEKLWGKITYNSDTGHWRAGEADMDEAVAPMEITERFQGVMGVKKVSPLMVGSCIDYVARSRPVSPWADWLGGLVWDGEARLAGWMSRACGAEDDSFNREVAVKWMVAIIERTLRPGAVVDWMLILEGPQGCGKTSLPGVLVPAEHLGIVMNAPHTQDKDLQAAAGMCRILCFDEMAVFFDRKLETEFIKGFVSAREDSFRPPYGRATVRAARGCVLYGTTNRPDVIKLDSSGYRRWVVVSVRGVVKRDGQAAQFDWDWLAGYRDQLWAEAMELWCGGAVDVSQVSYASRRAEAHVADIAEWDNYMAVLRANLTNVSMFHTHCETGAKMVDNVEFTLAYRALFGEKPAPGLVKSFWHGWDCEAVRGAKGRRYRAISSRLKEVLEEVDDAA